MPEKPQNRKIVRKGFKKNAFESNLFAAGMKSHYITIVVFIIIGTKLISNF